MPQIQIYDHTSDPRQKVVGKVLSSYPIGDGTFHRADIQLVNGTKLLNQVIKPKH